MKIVCYQIFMANEKARKPPKNVGNPGGRGVLHVCLGNSNGRGVKDVWKSRWEAVKNVAIHGGAGGGWIFSGITQ